MSIQGSLEDVGVADVMQFVHLGSSTGTLVLTSDDERVEIGFHDGGIINAWDSQSLRLGELLVTRGLVSRPVLETALALQATMRAPALSIGEILIREGLLDPADLRAAVVEQIRQSISRAIEWDQGAFVFLKGPPRRRDEFDPDAVLDYKLNTQGLLLDIARTLDHARHGLSTTPAEGIDLAALGPPEEVLARIAERPTLLSGRRTETPATSGSRARVEARSPSSPSSVAVASPPAMPPITPGEARERPPRRVLPPPLPAPVKEGVSTVGSEEDLELSGDVAARSSEQAAQVVRPDRAESAAELPPVAALDDFADLGDPTDLSDLGESDSGESDSAEAEVEPEPVAPPRPASELGQPREPGLSGMELQDENLRIAGDTEWRPLVRVISEDRSFADEFLAGLDCETEIISFREISWLSHQTPANILVVDMRPDRAMSELAAIISVAAGVEPVVVLPDVSKAGSAYDLGARAVIPDQPSALANYIGSMLLAAPTNVTQGSRALRPESRGFSRLREILSELRGSAPSATRILSLMRVVSDFAERAAVFVLTGNQMRIIGAFGSSATGAPLVDVIRKAGVLPLTGAFKEAVQRRTVLTSSYQESHFPPMLESALGAPANGRFHVVPIVGGEAVILLIYLDNGDALRPVEGLDVIELAGAQIGLMFENELLKRRSGGNDGDRREATTSSGSS